MLQSALRANRLVAAGPGAKDSRPSRVIARISEGLAALEQVETLRPHVSWIAAQAPAGILRGEHPEPPYAASS